MKTLNDLNSLLVKLKASIQKMQSAHLDALNAEKQQRLDQANQHKKLCDVLITISERFNQLQPLVEEYTTSTDCPPKIKRTLKSLMQVHTLVDCTLEEQGFSPMDLQLGIAPPLDYIKVEQVTPSSQPEQNSTLEKILKPGYLKDGQVYQKALVSLWKH